MMFNTLDYTQRDILVEYIIALRYALRIYIYIMIIDDVRRDGSP